MKAWLFTGVNEPLKLIERPDPQPGPGQVVIVTRWAPAEQVPTANHPAPSTSAAEAERQQRMKDGTW